jgi:CheY-like chemotaxis protein
VQVMSLFLVRNRLFLQANVHRLIRHTNSGMKRILVIDSHTGFRWVLRRILEREGYEVVEAGDGKEGIELYRQSPTDLIIMDVLMPEKDGVETLRELKQDFPDVKIIAMSAGSRSLSAQYCLAVMKALSAQYVFTKPFMKKELLDAVNELLDRQAVH